MTESTPHQPTKLSLPEQICAVCWTERTKICLIRNFYNEEYLPHEIRLCKICGQEVWDLCKEKDDSCEDESQASRHPVEHEDPALPFGQPGKVRWQCSWCDQDYRTAKNLVIVGLIYEIDGESGGRKLTFCPPNMSQLQMFVADKNPALRSAIFVCDRCGKRASSLAEDLVVDR